MINKIYTNKVKNFQDYFNDYLRERNKQGRRFYIDNISGELLRQNKKTNFPLFISSEFMDVRQVRIFPAKSFHGKASIQITYSFQNTDLKLLKWEYSNYPINKLIKSFKDSEIIFSMIIILKKLSNTFFNILNYHIHQLLLGGMILKKNISILDWLTQLGIQRMRKKQVCRTYITFLC